MKKILILSGGYSKEKEISRASAKSIYKTLKDKYKILVCEPDSGLVSKIKKFKPDVVYNSLHGRFGEDGYIQALLENLKVKYTHSGVNSSSIAMDKEISKRIFIRNNIRTPKFLKLNNFDLIKNKNILLKNIETKLGFPVVIKPVDEGSSVDVNICNKKNIIKNLKKLSSYKEVLVEKYIGGREIQVAIMGDKKLGVIELSPKRKFYDYKAKYNVKAGTKHIIPVDLSKKKINEVLNLALKAHKLIGCRGVTRSDFKYINGKFYLLEINTQPGMTKLSLVPEIAAYKGISFMSLLQWIINDASINR
ncbi:D-alanine--D-alanine ligase [Candidatus Pelagibacter sp.]|nr:D-alanine--D-alanine ligase [Candidatus Pelagibacter sp.]